MMFDNKSEKWQFTRQIRGKGKGRGTSGGEEGRRL